MTENTEDYRLNVLRAAGHADAAELLATLPAPAGSDDTAAAAIAAAERAAATKVTDLDDGPASSIARMTAAYERADTGEAA